MFAESLDCVDASIFISIPSLLVLRGLEDDDRGLLKYFNPLMYDDKCTENKL